MKPVSLKLAGLHSFREPQSIDFETLGEAGLFGIFGATGSGKSTILDAVTLALYGRVERAAFGTQGILNHAEERVLVEFTFELWTAEGRKRYRVERAYRRSRDSSVQNTGNRLIEIGARQETIIAEKGNVNAAVADLIGLSPDDFTRAVVLPQGKFAEFLSLKARDRRQMLQRLFNLQDYGDRLTARVRGRGETVRMELENIAGELEGLGDASDQALEQAREKFEEAGKLAEAASSTRRALADRCLEMEQVWQWQGELDRAKKALEELELQQPEINRHREILDRAQRAERVLPLLTGAREAGEAQQRAAARLDDAVGRLKAAAISVGRSGELMLRAKKARQRQEPLLQEKRAMLLQGIKAEHEVQRLRELQKNLAEEISKLSQRRSRVGEKLKNRQGQRSALEGEMSSLRARMKEIYIRPAYRRRITESFTILKNYRRRVLELEKYEIHCKGKARELKAAGENMSRAQERHDGVKRSLGEAWQREGEIIRDSPCHMEQIQVLIRELGENRARAEEYNRLVLELDDIHKELEEGRKNHLRAVKEREKAGEELGEAGAELERAGDILEQARQRLDTINFHNMAARLAGGLRDGEPCPVCGSADHPSPVAPTGERRLDEAREHLRTAQTRERDSRKRLEAAQRRESAASARVQGLAELLQGVKERLAQREEMLENARKALPPDWSGLEPEEMVVAITREEERIKALKNDSAQREGLLQEQRKLLQELQEKHKAAGMELARGKEAAAAAGKALEEAREYRNNMAAEVRELECLLDETRGDIPREEIEPRHKRIGDWDAEAGELTEKISQRENMVNQLVQAIETLNTEDSALDKEIYRLQEKSASASEELSDREAGLFALTGGKPVQDLLKETEFLIEKLRREEREAQDSHEQAGNDRTRAEREESAARSALSAARDNLNMARDKLEGILTETGFATGNEAEMSLLPPEERDRLLSRVEEHRSRLEGLTRELSRLEGCLGGRLLSGEEWLGWQERFKAAQREYEDMLRRQGAAEGEYLKLRADNGRWKELQSRKDKLAELMGRLETLDKLFRGNAFVEYLAEEQLVSIARDASARLGRLTRYRYALEVDSDGGFVMRDDGNGGVRRPVSTLSGGETFIASLALALALSAQIQLKGRYPLEFFFLDEGFGSLDPELLETVMTTLEQLRSEKITIGIISHVPELKNRMPRRLVVHGALLSGEGSRVSLEMA